MPRLDLISTRIEFFLRKEVDSWCWTSWVEIPFGLDGPYSRGQLTSLFLDVFPFESSTFNASFRAVRRLIDTFVTNIGM